MNWNKYLEAVNHKDFNSLYDLADRGTKVSVNRILNDAERCLLKRKWQQ